MADVLTRLLSLGSSFSRNVAVRYKSTSYQVKIRRDRRPIQKKLDATYASLSSKGFLRPLKEYNPPQDARERVLQACTRLGQSAQCDALLSDPAQRFALLNECYQDLQHGVPNSILNSMETVDDLVTFYETPVNTTTPLDAMKSADLPPNLHIQHEYHRFHPETDTLFKGVSAYPKSSTLITGLKYRKKYAGYKAKASWP